MENHSFLRQLCRFNNDVCGHWETSDEPTRKQIVACADAERELCAALHARESVTGLMVVLAERIARAEAETQVGVLIASGNAVFAKAWRDAEMSVAPPMPAIHNCFFSVTRVSDDSYRFFTLSIAR